MTEMDCPVCGSRPLAEFHYGGEPVERPSDSLELSPEELMQFLYLRGDSAQSAVELWWHRDGCGGWLRLERHRKTHYISAIASVRTMR